MRCGDCFSFSYSSLFTMRRAVLCGLQTIRQTIWFPGGAHLGRPRLMSLVTPICLSRGSLSRGTLSVPLLQTYQKVRVRVDQAHNKHRHRGKRLSDEPMRSLLVFFELLRSKLQITSFYRFAGQNGPCPCLTSCLVSSRCSCGCKHSSNSSSTLCKSSLSGARRVPALRIPGL